MEIRQYEQTKEKIIDCIRRNDYRGLKQYLLDNVEIQMIRAILASNGTDIIAIIRKQKLDFSETVIMTGIVSFISKKLATFKDTKELIDFLILKLNNYNDSITLILQDISK